jgi:DnaJ like chaperone protein
VARNWWLVLAFPVPLGFLASFIAEHTHEWKPLLQGRLVAPPRLLDRTETEANTIRTLLSERRTLWQERKEIDAIFARHGMPNITRSGAFDRRFKHADLLEHCWERRAAVNVRIGELDSAVANVKYQLEERKNRWAASVVTARLARELLTPCLATSACGLGAYYLGTAGGNYSSLWPVLLSGAIALFVLFVGVTLIGSRAQSTADAALKELGERSASARSDGGEAEEEDSEKSERSREERTEDETEEPAWWSVLQITQNASQEQIKTAYRSLMQQYHPDKVATLGPELRDLAERKSKEINAAYEQALRAVS